MKTKQELLDLAASYEADAQENYDNYQYEDYMNLAGECREQAAKLDERYVTEHADVTVEMPRNLQGKCGQDLYNYMTKHYNVKIDRKTGDETPANQATAYLRAVAKAIFNPEDWKAPIKAVRPECGLVWAALAIKWFHGAEPLTTFNQVVYSQGYQC